MQEAVITILSCALPILIPALVVGMIISIFQAATQINEQTLGFTLKIVVVFVALLMSIGFIVSTINDFTIRLYGYMVEWIR